MTWLNFNFITKDVYGIIILFVLKFYVVSARFPYSDLVKDLNKNVAEFTPVDLNECLIASLI
jgi:hypothetical protein